MVLKRFFNLHCCLNQGQDSFHCWVGWDVITHHLDKIGSTMIA